MTVADSEITGRYELRTAKANTQISLRYEVLAKPGTVGRHLCEPRRT